MTLANSRVTCTYTTQSPSPRALGIGITYPVSPGHGKWYDANAGGPVPKSALPTGKLTPDDTMHAIASGPPVPPRYALAAAGLGRSASTQSTRPRKCSPVAASATHRCTSSATSASAMPRRSSVSMTPYGMVSTLPK
ncbi:hypothetical protein EJB05_39351 [Eragrostis curvula]|uniref:Uncharacterized protein n=1 Tax=Eragrostis curvula TaxID=38414 RepID=A0A5J9TWP1_9POAL|nr:hypothetical protein EJB05_39351 [Eragrostis curvula]